MWSKLWNYRPKISSFDGIARFRNRNFGNDFGTMVVNGVDDQYASDDPKSFAHACQSQTGGGRSGASNLTPCILDLKSRQAIVSFQADRYPGRCRYASRHVLFSASCATPVETQLRVRTKRGGTSLTCKSTPIDCCAEIFRLSQLIQSRLQPKVL